MPANLFDRNGDIADQVTKRGKHFAEALDSVAYDTLYEMANQDQLTVAKVLLSIERRLSKLYTFFDQGRVYFK